MTRLPMVTATQVIRALERTGFIVVRSAGSHHMLVHPDDPARRATVPVHKGKDLPRGTLRNILKSSGLSEDEFRGLL